MDVGAWVETKDDGVPARIPFDPNSVDPPIYQMYADPEAAKRRRLMDDYEVRQFELEVTKDPESAAPSFILRYRHNGLAEAIEFSSGNYGGRLTNRFLAAQEAAQARSREEIRRLSAEAAESLRSLGESQRLLSEQAVQNERQAEEIRILNEQLAARKRDQFGPHSEKTHGSDVSSAKSAHESEKRPFSGAGRKRLPDGLDRVERVYDIKDGRCPICNAEMVELFNETENSELLRVQPIKFHVEDVVRTKYVCRHCKHFVTAPGPSRIAHSSYGSPDFSALTIVNKYQLGIPDYRQAHWFGSLGLKVPRITLDNNHIACAQRLRPLVDALRVALVEQPYIHADETTMQCLKENGRLPESKSWMFVYLSGECEDHPVVLFDYQHTRAGEHALHFLTRPDGTSFDGALQVDGFEGYNCLGSAERYGCMAHARRRFFKAEEAVPAGSEEESLAAQARKMIDEAYDVERSAKGLPWIERQKVRQEKTAPVMARLKEWLDAHAPDLPRRSLLGKAVHYMRDQWDRLTAFIDNGRIEIDNNSVERQIRKFVTGRKNWLFATSEAGAAANATLYSVVLSALANGADPYEYLLEVLTRIGDAATDDEIEALLPWNWKSRRRRSEVA